MIVIINGPCGIGKTEVSWKLVEIFDRAVMLDGDYIGAVHPFEIYDNARIAYLYQTIHHLVAFHVRHNYANIVVNYVFETPESLAQLRVMLSDHDDVTYAFRLTGAEDEVERRIRGRNTEQVAWELERFRELTKIMRVAADHGDMGYEIETSGLTAMQVAEAIWQNIHEAIEIFPYDPVWPAAYSAEDAQIRAALGSMAIGVHHIGSTAVPKLDAKPIIDIMVTVRQLEDAIACIAPLRSLGYAFIDYPQNTDRRFFRKDSPRPAGCGTFRTHHLHIVEQNSASLVDHLAFRDALRVSSELREQYATLKAELAAGHKDDRATYSERKSAFIESVLRP